MEKNLRGWIMGLAPSKIRPIMKNKKMVYGCTGRLLRGNVIWFDAAYLLIRSVRWS
jgi:hypothetical protein